MFPVAATNCDFYDLLLKNVYFFDLFFVKLALGLHKKRTVAKVSGCRVPRENLALNFTLF
jgi:hypothetical protein